MIATAIARDVLATPHWFAQDAYLREEEICGQPLNWGVRHCLLCA